MILLVNELHKRYKISFRSRILLNVLYTNLVRFRCNKLPKQSSNLAQEWFDFYFSSVLSLILICFPSLMGMKDFFSMEF